MVQSLPELIAALSFFGLLVIMPLVYMIQKHQKAMMENIHKQPSNELLRRIDLLENEVRELRSANMERLLREDDEQQLLRQRLG